MNSMKIKYSLFLIVLAIVSCQGNREFESPNMPLWKITNAQGKSSYLLGTTEYLPKDSARILFNELLISSFDSAEVFLTQIDVANSYFGQTKLALEIPDDKLMKEYLSENEFQKLQQLQKNWKYKGQNSMPAADSTRLKLVFYLHDMIYLNNQSNFYFDKFWVERAMPLEKKISGLETYQSYYEGFQVLSKADEVNFMNSIQSLDVFVDSLRSSSQALYMSGEFAEIHALYLSLFPYLKAHYQTMVADKHKTWAKKIGESSDSVSTFVTLDVFHMVGKQNLIHELLSKGYNVKRIQ